VFDDQARKWVFGGRVQGVGFRPFVYRTAHRYQVSGWVRNLAGRVEVLAQGNGAALASFGDALVLEAPPLARPEKISEDRVPCERLQGFAILESVGDALSHVKVPADSFTCDACLSELGDARDRRHRYPFINCTQCGPRFTVIRALPYDRPNTTLASFALCEHCRAEYESPSDRRFHAQPLACPECGPHLEYRGAEGRFARERALEACVAALLAGAVVAVKGIGGYHLMCDATSPDAVARLRRRKVRPHKPLAVMFPMDAGLAWLHRAARVGAAQEAWLRDPMRPIVLLPRSRGSPLAPEVAPGCDEIGAFLPYSPLHHLLLADAGRPLVATSANPTGEPVLTDNDEAESRLGAIADAFLHHDRPIARPADDPVYRWIGGAPRPLRVGRGNAPLELDLPFELPRPVLALGGHLKKRAMPIRASRRAASPRAGACP
jgi:hydrogenase maturation protein HypF